MHDIAVRSDLAKRVEKWSIHKFSGAVVINLSAHVYITILQMTIQFKNPPQTQLVWKDESSCIELRAALGRITRPTLIKKRPANHVKPNRGTRDETLMALASIYGC